MVEDEEPTLAGGSLLDSTNGGSGGVYIGVGEKEKAEYLSPSPVVGGHSCCGYVSSMALSVTVQAC